MASMPLKSDLDPIYDAHAQALFGFVLSLTHNEADTRDLLQELFIRLARRPDLMAGVRDERAFLLRMAHRMFIDFHRRRASRGRTHDKFGEEGACCLAPAVDPDTVEFRIKLDRALALLPPNQRVVVHLKLWEGATFDAIAHTLDISPNTAASRYRYALDKLRHELRPLYDEIR